HREYIDFSSLTVCAFDRDHGIPCVRPLVFVACRARVAVRGELLPLRNEYSLELPLPRGGIFRLPRKLLAMKPETSARVLEGIAGSLDSSHDSSREEVSVVDLTELQWRRPIQWGETSRAYPCSLVRVNTTAFLTADECLR